MYWIATGIFAMFVISVVDYQLLLENVHWMYLVSIGSLLSVLAFGQRYLGAKRWIKFPGGQHFQPSEWVKLILILAVAKYFADARRSELTFFDMIKARSEERRVGKECRSRW